MNKIITLLLYMNSLKLVDIEQDEIQIHNIYNVE